MASKSYMQGRMSFLKGGTRPQAMLWSNNAGTLDNGYYVPTGTEGEDFIIVSDHNRSDINISQDRIETRKRMINGGMRSYWIADKLKISTSWNRLPSRPFDIPMNFLEDGQPAYSGYTSYTVDGAAGGMDMVSWYEDHPGPFYLYLSYDRYRVNGVENYSRLGTYTHIIRAYFASFDYNVEKRSGGGFDFWNISLTMEEV